MAALRVASLKYGMTELAAPFHSPSANPMEFGMISFWQWRDFPRVLWLMLLTVNSTAFAQGINAPSQANADSQISIQLEGIDNPRDFITIVAKGTAEGRYEEYAYTDGGSVTLFAPVNAGDYEIRWLGAETPYRTLTSAPLQVVATSAQVKAPESVGIGKPFELEWQGPNNPQDFVTLVPVGTAEGKYADYVYTSDGSPVSMTAPSTAGQYELRYLTGRGYKTLGKTALTVVDASASVQFQSPAGIGQTLEIQWSGPANTRDYITVVPASARDGHYNQYTYVSEGNPLKLVLPEKPGEYEIRYMTGDSERVLARAPLQVMAADASVSGPASVVARSLVKVQWSGPNNPQDYIAITQPGKPSSYLSYSYTSRGNPVEIEVPKQSGDYEIHYLTAQTNQSLASQKLQVTPAATPGFLEVSATASNVKPGYDTVEVVLDASGSMLQKLDGKRRIDIAKATLGTLLDALKPADTHFALRVFGHRKADACDTELLLPPAPAQTASIRQTISKLEAKNLARTPIADSLAQVQQDLVATKGKSLVILLTDGEETCDGDPAAAIRKLRASGLDVRVNIVGFAIGEYALKQQFSGWADAGGGTYFDAQDAAALSSALTQSLQVPFMVLNRNGVAVASSVAGEAALELPAGDYKIKSGNHEMPVTISSGETARVTLP